MNWVNIHVSRTLRSPEFIGSEPLDRATWLALLGYCCEQENSGIIADCADWGNRRWMQSCAVTKEEVQRPSKLWSWNARSLCVFGYSLEKEAEIKQKRDWGKRYGKTSGPCKARPGNQNARKNATSHSDKTQGEGVKNAIELELEREREVEREVRTCTPPASLSARNANVNGNKFIKPSLEEVKLHAAKAGLPDAEAERFHAYYESNGWRVGRNPMKSWQAAMVNWKRTWESRIYERPGLIRQQAPSKSLQERLAEESARATQALLRNIENGKSL